MDSVYISLADPAGMETFPFMPVLQYQHLVCLLLSIHNIYPSESLCLSLISSLSVFISLAYFLCSQCVRLNVPTVSVRN